MLKRLFSNAYTLATRINLARWIIVVSALKIVLGIIVRLTGSYLWDDALMFARYADNFLAYGTIAWNPGGEAVYGTTAPLFLMLVIVLHVVFSSNLFLVLWFASVFCGLGFIVLITLLMERHIKSEPTIRDWVGALVFFSLAVPNTMLLGHLPTGMDTTLALGYLTGFLLLLKHHERVQSRTSAFTTGLVAGVAFFCRPDLLIFTFIIPTFIAIADSSAIARRNAWIILVTATGAVGSEMLMAQWLVNSPLPLPFFAKGLKLYDDAFYLQYTGKSWEALQYFLSAYWYLFVLIAADLVLNFKQWQTGRTTEKGMLIASVAFIAYFTFFVVQIMGWWARFYLPVLPVLLWLAAHSVVAFLQRLNHITDARLRWGGWGMVALIALVALAFLSRRTYWEVHIFPSVVRGGAFANFDATNLYVSTGTRTVWYRLEDIAQLPDDLVIAATEVGYLGALNPRKTIIDLAGLNTPDFARPPFSADLLFSRYHPDLIYLPHPDYKEMNRSILNAPWFQENYFYWNRSELGVQLDVAIRRDSKHFDALRQILEKGKISSPVRSQ